jgi:hypothetical protein
VLLPVMLGHACVAPLAAAAAPLAAPAQGCLRLPA